MRRRNRSPLAEEQQETDRWLISYADFITLLFAFFVVMYSISQINESKYKILSDALQSAFDSKQSALVNVPVGETARSLSPQEQALIIATPGGRDHGSGAPKIPADHGYASEDDFQALEAGLRNSLSGLIEQDLAGISSDSDWIHVNLRSGVLFPSGSDRLNTSADVVLQELSQHLNQNQQRLLIHGHTDNVPINDERFPSNWELSSARAVAVVRKLQNLQVAPPRMSVEGHGEFQPLASNETAEGRAKNRRVVVSISRKQTVSLLQPSEQAQTAQATEVELPTKKESEPEFDIIRLSGGGILIRGKSLPAETAEEE